MELVHQRALETVLKVTWNIMLWFGTDSDNGESNCLIETQPLAWS